MLKETEQNAKTWVYLHLGRGQNNPGGFKMWHLFNFKLVFETESHYVALADLELAM